MSWRSASSSSRKSADDEFRGPLEGAEEDYKSGSLQMRHCMDVVRSLDYPSFLCTALLPTPELRVAGYTLRALSLEWGMVRDSSKDDSLALLRLRWWRDTVQNLFRGMAQGGSEGLTEAMEFEPSQTPTVEMLALVLHRCPEMESRFVVGMVDARMADIQANCPMDLEDIELFGEDAYANMYYALMQVAKVDCVQTARCASHLSRALALCNNIRSIPWSLHTTAGAPLPTRMVARHKVDITTLADKMGETVGLKDLVFEVAQRAFDHIASARSIAQEHELSADSQLLLLPCVTLEHFLHQLSGADFDPFVKSLYDEANFPPTAMVDLRMHAWRGEF